jgi:hypothetical protein
VGEPIPLSMIVARTHMYTHAANVWDVSIAQGPFSVAPRQTLIVTTRNFPNAVSRQPSVMLRADWLTSSSDADAFPLMTYASFQHRLSASRIPLQSPPPVIAGWQCAASPSRKMLPLRQWLAMRA